MTWMPGIPEEMYETLRASMFGQMSPLEWSKEELSDKEEFIRWALEDADVMSFDELKGYDTGTVRRMLSEVYDNEIREWCDVNAGTISLYDYLKAHGGSSDVWDAEFDSVVCWDIPDSEDRDDWAKICRYMMRNIRYVRGQAPYEVVADKAGFVREHLSELGKITKLYYDDEYQVVGDDPDSIAIGVELLDDLQTGNFPDVGYKEVARIFGLVRPSGGKSASRNLRGKSAKGRSSIKQKLALRKTKKSTKKSATTNKNTFEIKFHKRKM